MRACSYGLTMTFSGATAALLVSSNPARRARARGDLRPPSVLGAVVNLIASLKWRNLKILSGHPRLSTGVCSLATCGPPHQSGWRAIQVPRLLPSDFTYLARDVQPRITCVVIPFRFRTARHSIGALHARLKPLLEDVRQNDFLRRSHCPYEMTVWPTAAPFQKHQDPAVAALLRQVHRR